MILIIKKKPGFGFIIVFSIKRLLVAFLDQFTDFMTAHNNTGEAAPALR